MTLKRKLEARGESVLPPGFYDSQFTALDTHALLTMIMHDALKGPARENCLSESQMPRANFSQLTK